MEKKLILMRRIKYISFLWGFNASLIITSYGIKTNLVNNKQYNKSRK